MSPRIIAFNGSAVDENISGKNNKTKVPVISANRGAGINLPIFLGSKYTVARVIAAIEIAPILTKCSFTSPNSEKIPNVEPLIS